MPNEEEEDKRFKGGAGGVQAEYGDKAFNTSAGKEEEWRIGTKSVGDDEGTNVES